jgi:hypothetical protein
MPITSPRLARPGFSFPPCSRWRRSLLVAALLALASPLLLQAASPLALHRVELELPGAPAAVVPTDLDGDGDLDLAMLVAWTEWGQLSVEERTTFSGIEGLVEMLTIVPSLFDRRELRAYLAEGAGQYRLSGPPLEAPADLLALDAGPPGAPLVALTDGGAVAYRLDAAGSLAAGPLVTARPVLAGSGAFLPGLELVSELSGDDLPDLLLPTADGVLVHLGEPGGFAAEPVARVSLPGERWFPSAEGPRRQYPLPVVGDLDGDRLPDLLWRHPEEGWGLPVVARGLGGGRFAPQRTVDTAATGWRPAHQRATAEEEDDDEAQAPPRPVLVADLDGDGRAELVSEQTMESDEDGFRAGMREAGSPAGTVRLHRLAADLSAAGPAFVAVPIRGYAFAEGSDISLPGGLRDLDGDGRRDLVAMTLDFKLRKLMAAVVTKTVSLPVDFHVWCQGADGSFRAVGGLDLSGELKVDLDRFELRRMPAFSGDFDGDGRVDFVQLGRGREVSIHRGAPGCRFPAKADLAIRLRRAPERLELVRVADLDGDGRADLMVIHPRQPDEPGETAPVTLELHVSGGAR